MHRSCAARRSLEPDQKKEWRAPPAMPQKKHRPSDQMRMTFLLPATQEIIIGTEKSFERGFGMKFRSKYYDKSCRNFVIWSFRRQFTQHIWILSSQPCWNCLPRKRFSTMVELPKLHHGKFRVTWKWWRVEFRVPTPIFPSFNYLNPCWIHAMTCLYNGIDNNMLVTNLMDRPSRKMMFVLVIDWWHLLPDILLHLESKPYSR